ncbi:glycosyltransferase family 4 protein [Dyadobacter chenhuakuii]|uniref:Glycosyltransferase n=1 Tax=Dyadobacter chenhuakuii TaxID=2909339 RepID=A0ABY4XQU3_9BACT|nr:glycosyltransferase [Dyadobacter chenhuakuii]MCF2492899.1 glycosyltransferase [Dyadobacter chenhuakuii]USJ32811.1 glycosyltransferase [Dyadobacter chenhuakuii]
MKISFVGTFPPRECGIGTFTKNLYDAVNSAPGADGPNTALVVAMDDNGQHYDYPKEVKLTIRQEEQADYLEAASFINISGADICVLQHEFGIFGGQNGIYILPFLYRLKIPLIVTLHTVLKNPSYNERAVMIEICKIAQRVVVMTRKAVDMLMEEYGVAESKIEQIAHGVPDIQFDQQSVKKEFKLLSRKVLLTFGFIGRNKGIEIALKALPAVVAKYPQLVYIVLGKTHPNVIRHSGEEYRIFLLGLVKKLGIEKHVIFMNEFVDQTELFKYLSASDIYITPYTNEAQITSGTLSYAIGAGSAVISTPYWHAAELLSEGRGRLFPFNDVQALSEVFLDLLDHPDTMMQLRSNAFNYGREITWPKIGAKYAKLAEKIVSEQPDVQAETETILDLLALPPFLLDHVQRLTDDTGIIQHAKYGIPNLKEGYCLDDNARALLMVLMTYKRNKNPLALKLSPTYLSYINYMQNPDGAFRNFLSFNRNFLDEVGSEDSFGRTIWALGYLLGNAPNDAYYQTGRDIFFDASPNFVKLQSIRSIANTIVGICHYLKSNSGDEGMIEVLRQLTNRLMVDYELNRTDDWHWYESLLAYDNAFLPLAMLHAAEFLNDERVNQIALESMEFLSKITLNNGYLSIVGNEKWYLKDGESSMFAQQPLDALAMVLMFHQAFRLTSDPAYVQQLNTCFMWFLGENDLRISLYDFETKGCCDGLERYGVNRNQGAESTLAYLISHLSVLEAFEELTKLKAAHP